MSILQTEQLPSGLVGTISKLASFQKQTRKLNCDVSSASPNGTVNVKLPTSGLLNLGTLQWHALVTVAGEPAYSPALGCYISQLRVLADGQVVDNINMYNILFQQMMNLSCSDAHQQTRYAMKTLGPKGTYVMTNTVTADSLTDAALENVAEIAAGDAAATYGTPSYRLKPTYLPVGSVWACEVDWLGFLSSLNYILADQFPSLSVEFLLGGNNILGNTDTGSGTWSITNQYFTLDVINYNTAMEAFQNLFFRNPGVITPITYSFDRWIVQGYACQASTTNTINFNVSSSNLRKIFYTFREAAYGTQDELDNGSHASNFFITTALDGTSGGYLTESVLYVNGKQYNEFGPINLAKDASGNIDPSGFVSTLTQLNAHQDLQFDCQINSLNDYIMRKFCHLYSFDWVGSGPNVISGLNTMGQSDCQLSVKSDAALTAGGQWVLMAQASSLLHISPNRVIEIEN